MILMPKNGNTEGKWYKSQSSAIHKVKKNVDLAVNG
jgi:hypothetical protein